MSEDLSLERRPGSGPRCPACGAPAPVARLQLAAAGAGEAAIGDLNTAAPAGGFHLLPRDHLLGRGAECDLLCGYDHPGLSRHHARLIWTGSSFEIADADSTNGTALNGQPLTPGERRALADGDRLSLGGLEIEFRDLRAPAAPHGGLPYDRLLRLLSEMSSLDVVVVVDRSLELLRSASGVQRSYIVDAGADPRLGPLLTPLDDPGLQVSRSAIEEALETGRPVSHFLPPDASVFPTRSIQELDLRRVWVRPVLGEAGRPVAAVYLDSAEAGARLDEPTERLMEALVEQIGMALRNASLHAEVVALNEGLERKVRDRTRELEESRTLLIGQDRLATMGRLVAAIAHELNNPAGALASLSQTLRPLLRPLTALGDDLSAEFKDPEDAAVARRFLDVCLASVSREPLDTRGRRDLGERLRLLLEEQGATGAGEVSRRLARIGLQADDIRPFLPLLKDRGEFLASLAERLSTFGKGLRTIGDCSGNIARIVDGLKTYAHIDRARFEPADVNQGVEAALTVLAPRIPWGVRVITRFDDILPFPQRPGELMQVWTNLIDNAVKVMGDEGTLTIETHDEGEAVRVVVADTGPGVPDDLRERIFDLDATSRGPGAGLGLGLPICRTIVEKNHGGTISFESRPGETAFTVVLPRDPPAGGEEGP